MTSSRAEAPDQAAKLEAMQKKLLLEMKAAQANQLKTLRADMSKETKRIETASQAQVCTAHSCAAVFRDCWVSCSQDTILPQTCPVGYAAKYHPHRNSAHCGTLLTL